MALLYIIIYLFLQFIFFEGVLLFEGDPKNYSGVVTILAAMAAMGIYGIIFYLRSMRMFDNIKVRRLSLIDIVLSFSLAIGFRILTAVYFLWAENVPILSESIENAPTAYNFSTMTNFGMMTILFSMFVMAPLFEEFLFRGIMQKELARVMPLWLAIVIQGIVFGIVHQVLVQCIFSAIFGVILGVLYYKTKNLNITILAHACFNLSTVLNIKEGDSIVKVVFMGIILTVTSLTFFFYIYKRKTAPVNGALGGNRDDG